MTVILGLAPAAAQGSAQTKHQSPLPRITTGGQTDWPLHNLDLQGSRYSPLDAIDTSNVGRLALSWSFEAGDGLRARSPAGQGSEVVLGCEILNRMTELGRPVSYRIGR